MPKVPFEYFDPKAPWNRHAKPPSATSREWLIRRHLDALLPRHETGRFENPFRHIEESLLREIIPCSASEQKDSKVLEANEKWVTENWAPLANRLKLDKNAFGAFDPITHEQREEIVRTLRDVWKGPLYEFTSQERIDAWKKHLDKKQKT